MPDTRQSFHPPRGPECLDDPRRVGVAPAPVERAQSARRRAAPTAAGDAGQATAEYALVLLGAAAVALLLIGWATTTDQISRLFDFVIEQVIGRSG